MAVTILGGEAEMRAGTDPIQSEKPPQSKEGIGV
jgi:hypothetical protein